MRSLITTVFLLFCTAQAHAMGGVNPSCMAPVSGHAEPAPAIAHGFNCARISENFGSADNIDVNQTGNLNYTWRNGSAPAPTFGYGPFLTSGEILFSPGALKLVNTRPVIFPGLFSSWSPNSDGVETGKTFGNGVYFECNMSVDYSGATTADLSISWSACVLSNYNIFTSNPSFCPPGGEIDNIEYIPTGNGTVNLAQGINQFGAGSPCAGSQGTGGGTFSPNAVISGITPDNAAHTWGRLWLTAAQNGGTGLYQEYYDGLHLTTQCVTGNCDTSYTPGGNFSDVEGTQQYMALDTGVGSNFTTTFYWVHAWTR